MKTPGSAQDPLWFKDAIIYELHVKTFFDGNNDGIGDFPGLIQKLDYIQDLGVTCLWLLPFFPSPLRDDGYDIADYTDVHPSYGTLDDFKEFLAGAHERGLQVMIELVINHTSDQHPWFQRARQAPKGSPERNFYVWSDTEEKYRGARIIFTDTEKSNWTWDPVAKEYYWHRFFSHQPDLNYDSPEVIEEVLKVMRYWLDMGVDGLRLDAIPYLVERDGTNCENLPETHAAVKRIRRELDERYANRMILAEANQWPSDVREYFGDGDECHMAFHFPLMPRLFMALRLEDRHPIIDIIEQTPDIPENCQWGLFLRNHDELTLEMVSNEERDYMYLAYSADPRMRVNIGIRRRLAPLMDNNRRRIELLCSLLFSFPGTPILYYGDELGMGDNIYLGDRNGVRTPMQWNSDRNAGFSRASPAKLYSPVIIDPIYGYEALNVEAQLSDASSLLHWMRHMIALRKLFRVFGRGSIRFLRPANQKILAYIRQFGEEMVLCVANLSRFAQPAELDLTEFAGMTPVEMLGYVDFPKIGRAPYPLTLGPYGSLWFELHGEPEPTPAEGQEEGEQVLAVSTSGALASLFTGTARATLETRILPAFLPKQRWFGSKSRFIKSTRIRDWGVLPRDEAALLLVEVTYAEGEPETYFLPVAFAPPGILERLGEAASLGVLCLVKAGAETRRLLDASWDPEASRAFLAAVSNSETWSLQSGTITAQAGTAVPASKAPYADSAIRRVTSEQSNTSILFDGDLILKLFRKLTPGVNPDCEIGRHLTEDVGFDGIPSFGGQMEYASASGPPETVAMLQGLVENQGDGWHATLEELRRYYESCLSQERPPLPLDLNSLFESRPGSAPAARDIVGVYYDSAVSLGRKTAQMHLALAAPTNDPAFTPEPLGREEIRRLARDFRVHAGSVFDSLRDNLARLPDELLEDTSGVLSMRRRILHKFDLLEALDANCVRTRIHGDYHLGQVLRVKDGFVILDFEGEPARSIEERRAKQSPLKDVAGMLRSLSYAAQASLLSYVARSPDHAQKLEPWASAWEQIVSWAFLQAYRDAAGQAVFLPSDPLVFRRLLEGFLLDKALYEVRYELNNRPAWLRIPLLAIEALSREPAG